MSPWKWILVATQGEATSIHPREGIRATPGERLADSSSRSHPRGGPAEAPPQLVEPDQGLGVRHLVDQRVELGERAGDDLDALVLVRLGARVGEARGQVDPHLLVGEAGRGPVALELLPLLRGLADLLRELAPGGLERRLVLDVELSRRQLEQVGHADRLARLAHEEEPLAVVRDDGDRALVADDLAPDLLAVLVAEGLEGDGGQLALVDGLRGGAVKARAHGRASTRAASSSSARQTSSIDSRAATATRSVGSWFRSVPLARLTTVGPPAAISALASEPPPVATRRGS